MAWIRIIAPEAADGPLKEAYDWQAARLGFASEFTQLGSLAPDLVNVRLELYKVSENIASKLTTRQKNLIGHVVSILNATPYCASQSRVKLRELGVSDDDRSAIERGDYDGFDAADAAILRYARRLTTAPGSVTHDDVEALRAAGLDDLDILHVNNQIAHLNYTNRVANGLGLLHEIDAETYNPFDAIPS
ncbi:MAG: peroxidase-related enzyme [Actinomycetota bacterium]|jgi:uncharacterized peroxidase-related enzyme